MADHSAPDYPLDETLTLESTAQYKALFEDTRLRISDLLLERAATIKDLSDALGKPKGTIGHHVAVMEEAGLIKVVRTKKVRAIEAKYYGRAARTFIIDKTGHSGISLPAAHFLATAAEEYTRSAERTEGHDLITSTLRYARVPAERAGEWKRRLLDLALEFSAEPRAGDTTYGLILGFYPTDRAHLPDQEQT